MTCVGVLALQGAFREHIEHIQLASHDHENISTLEVRNSADLSKCDALIIPGGESTAISYIAERSGLLPYLYDFMKSEKPVWGTCAGLIFLAKEVINAKPDQKCLGGLDIAVERNAFGRQLDSFDEKLDFSSFIAGLTEYSGVFIRAPVVRPLGTTGDSTVKTINDYQNPAKLETLYVLNDSVHASGLVVAVRQGSKLGTSFHPELAGSAAFHRWFLDEFVLSNKNT